MKKKFILLTATLAILLAGCSASPTPTADNSAEIESLKAQIEDLKKENKDLKAQLDAIPETTVEETEEAQKGTPISIGDTITTDTMEITINKVELTYDVLPDDTSSVYSHYEADPGNVFLHVDTDVKNLGKQNLPCDNILSVVADYNGGYQYSGQATPEDGTHGFTYANISTISPLETLGIRFLFECPQEVEETGNPLFIILEPKGTNDSYILTVR